MQTQLICLILSGVVGRVWVQRPENSICGISEHARHSKMGLSRVLRPKWFPLDVEEPTHQVPSCLIPSLDLKTSLKAEKRPESAVYFCLWFLGQAIHSWICGYTVLFLSSVSQPESHCNFLGLFPYSPLPQTSLVIPSFPLLPWIGNHYDEARLVSDFHENHSQVITTLGLETEKAAIPAWLAPSLWVTVETLSPDAAERAGLLMSSSVRWDPDPLTS